MKLINICMRCSYSTASLCQHYINCPTFEVEIRIRNLYLNFLTRETQLILLNSVKIRKTNVTGQYFTANFHNLNIISTQKYDQNFSTDLYEDLCWYFKNEYFLRISNDFNKYFDFSELKNAVKIFSFYKNFLWHNNLVI